jgi:glyoxylase-like metal-dependent hydrolase (beta-lactamase superfamily II)/rhodanese-related sulfurtransferase
MIEILTVPTPSLGDRTYLATDGSVALVVDPQRDIDRILALAGSLGVTVTHVFETHVHNDYLTGGLALARATGAAYHLNVADRVAFARTGVRDRDVIEVGSSMRVHVIATPGHTFTHLAYALEDVAAGEPVAVFSGGSLLYGSTGRTDLLGDQHAAGLAAAQHRSARRLAALLPAAAALYPTHGFGSFCAAAPSRGGSGSTIGDERRGNPALTQDEDRYVRGLLAGLDDYPAYYARMAPANAAGPVVPALAPPAPASFAELAARIAAGEWVVDLRPRGAFAAGHVPGSLSFEYGDGFATNLGWLLPTGTPLTLIADDPRQIACAQRDLARIGIDRITGAVTGRCPGGRVSYRVSDFAGLAEAWQGQSAAVTALALGAAVPGVASGVTGVTGGAGVAGVAVALGPLTVLDVRRRLEFAAGHLEGALHVPLHRLPGRVPDLPPGPIWVHCQAGYRAAIAASILHAAGRAVTAIDDSYDHAADAGLPVTRVPVTAGASSLT